MALWRLAAWRHSLMWQWHHEAAVSDEKLAAMSPKIAEAVALIHGLDLPRRRPEGIAILDCEFAARGDPEAAARLGDLYLQDFRDPVLRGGDAAAPQPPGRGALPAHPPSRPAPGA